jgi:hypothetical protein
MLMGDLPSLASRTARSFLGGMIRPMHSPRGSRDCPLSMGRVPMPRWPLCPMFTLQVCLFSGVATIGRANPIEAHCGSHLAFNRTSPSNRPSCSMIQLCGCFAMASSHCSTVASVGGNKAGTVSEALGSTPNICTIAGSKPRARRSATSLGSGFRSVRPYRSKLV